MNFQKIFFLIIFITQNIISIFNPNFELLKNLYKKKLLNEKKNSKREKLENYLKNSKNEKCDEKEPVCGVNKITYKNKCICPVDISYIGTCENYYEYQKFENMKNIFNFYNYE